MIRALRVLIFGVAIAVIVISVAVLAAISVVTYAAKVALLGEGRHPFAATLIERYAKRLPSD